MSTGVHVAAQVLEKMRVEARTRLPLECCGLLAGAEGVITEIIPTTNARESPDEFFVPPEELISVFCTLRERGKKLLGIYHSHPRGASVPSRRDVEMAYYPACAYFIVSPHAPQPERAVRAFEIADGKVTELDIEVV